ncbi:MAG: aspartate carbamoyltransferase regulatory subunit [Chlamydiota bacterium]
MNTLSILALKSGTIIDHIPEHTALNILQCLRKFPKSGSLTIGISLLSEKLGRKDLIKMHDRKLSPEEMTYVALFAPNATINVIEDHCLITKSAPTFPEEVIGIFSCLNPRCITHVEHVPSHFFVDANRAQMHLQCRYCQSMFPRDALQEYAL